MANAEKTSLLLAEELKQQCKTVSLHRITVGGLCTACGLDRRTFYYHFRDIYDLSAWIYDSSIAKFLPDGSSPAGIGRLDEVLRQIKEDFWFYRRALDDTSQNALGRHILRHNALTYVETRKRFLGAEQLCEEDLFAIEYHCFGVLGMVRRWIFYDCSYAPEQLALRILSAMPNALRVLYVPAWEEAPALDGDEHFALKKSGLPEKAENKA